MAMIPLNLPLLCLIVTLFHNLSPVACINQNPTSSETAEGLLFEGKSRLGSTPPTCYNKCNQCHPCVAVQVPTLPSHGRFQPIPLTSAVPAMEYYYLDSPPSSSTNKYSNYKPLGWKCRCVGQQPDKTYSIGCRASIVFVHKLECNRQIAQKL
ncbi:hypothetical protein NMG60_11016970 [Bertholletia excelsa]